MGGSRQWRSASPDLVRERDRLGVGGCARRGRLGGARERPTRGGGVVRGGGSGGGCEEGVGWGVVRGGGGSGWGVVRRGGGWGSSGWLGKEQRQRKRKEKDAEQRAEASRVFRKMVYGKFFPYFRVSNPKRTKFGPRAIKSVFVDYAVNSKKEMEKRSFSKLPFVGNVKEDPNTFSKAMVSRDAASWREAVNDEMDSILSNNTWVLVDLPPGSNTIGCKWVFRRKYRTDGTIQTFKVRLVAKGFRQREGIDYFDTYAPVARITSIRVLIALASIYKLMVHQMDVKRAFLNGDLDEEVYMDQPEGFVLPGNEKKVSNGFKHNGADKCVYSKFTSEYGVIVCLYADDMLIFRTKMLGVCETKKYLASVFKMKDLNEVDTILGIKVNTPFDSNYKLVENTGRAIAQLEFANAIGSMMYAMHCTRPDIAFAVNRLSRYTSNPSAEHWKAIARVLGYLKKTKDLGLYYSGYPAVLEGYSDTNWVTSVGDNKSTSG
uniref:Reverse transcriptase Ty1/copia-type domain-containing protein n=1 Tax=Fagus sylvatica TaxID=28930 RepID=A0A2N9HAT5_FAGSY